MKIDAIYALYPESFCDKNLAIRKFFAFCDSAQAKQLEENAKAECSSVTLLLMNQILPQTWMLRIYILETDCKRVGIMFRSTADTTTISFLETECKRVGILFRSTADTPALP